MGSNFLLAIVDKAYIGKIEGANAYVIKSVELFPFSTFNQQLKPYIDGIKKILA